MEGGKYRMTFGQHRGKTLQEVPPSYINWMTSQGIPSQRPALDAALRDHQKLRANINNPSNWNPPGIYDTTDARFFDAHTQDPKWISDADVCRYFWLQEPQLSALGVGLVSEEDVRREAQFEHLVSVFPGPERWLYQVYTCARMLDTMPPDAGNVDDALDGFLGKNRRREEYIFDAMGFGV